MSCYNNIKKEITSPCLLNKKTALFSSSGIILTLVIAAVLTMHFAAHPNPFYYAIPGAVGTVALPLFISAVVGLLSKKRNMSEHISLIDTSRSSTPNLQVAELTSLEETSSSHKIEVTMSLPLVVHQPKERKRLTLPQISSSTLKLDLMITE